MTILALERFGTMFRASPCIMTLQAHHESQKFIVLIMMDTSFPDSVVSMFCLAQSRHQAADSARNLPP